MQERKAKSIVDIIDLIKDHEAAVWVILGDEPVPKNFLLLPGSVPLPKWAVTEILDKRILKSNIRIYYFDDADTLHISTDE